MAKYFKLVRKITDASTGDEVLVTSCFQKEGDKNKSIPEAVGNTDYDTLMEEVVAGTSTIEVVETD